MIATFHSDPVEMLKAMWRGNAAMSNLLPLDGKLAAIEAAKAGATPTEAMYFGQGYRLPTGWGWNRVAQVRRIISPRTLSRSRSTARRSPGACR